MQLLRIFLCLVTNFSCRILHPAPFLGFFIYCREKLSGFCSVAYLPNSIFIQNTTNTIWLPSLYGILLAMGHLLSQFIAYIVHLICITRTRERSNVPWSCIGDSHMRRSLSHKHLSRDDRVCIVRRRILLIVVSVSLFGPALAWTRSGLSERALARDACNGHRTHCVLAMPRVTPYGASSAGVPFRVFFFE